MHQSAYICIVAMALLKRIVSSKGFGGWVLSLRYIKRQERLQTYWNFNNNLKTIGNLFHFINLGHLSVKYTWPASSTFANKFPNRIYVDLVWKFDITMLFNGVWVFKKEMSCTMCVIIAITITAGKSSNFCNGNIRFIHRPPFSMLPWWIKDYSPQSKALHCSGIIH